MSDIDLIERIESKIDRAVEKVEARIDKLNVAINGDEDKPGIKGRIDRLEQIESWRKWVVRGVGGAVIIQAIAAVKGWLTGNP